ncbi:hypothetical protein BX281_0754 [Streptomyces sp. Ag82_O1-15]|jgi:hypothetical protein|nr:hypothetical protein BX281_0754 [Streptomyces sp. Ag82_O1-15]
MASLPWSKSAGAKAPAGDAVDPPVVTGELAARNTADDAAGWLECMTAPSRTGRGARTRLGWGRKGPWPAVTPARGPFDAVSLRQPSDSCQPSDSEEGM